jgi:tetratricopeptide (TPR) repeat protein
MKKILHQTIGMLLGLSLLILAAPAQAPRRAAQDFNAIQAQATSAREAGRIDEAIALYRRAVEARAEWGEGWWYLATLLYERDRYAEAARAFAEAARLQPQAGATWAMLGLCEFQLARYDDALNHIQQGRRLGLGANEEIARAIQYHAGLLFLLKGEFETAQQTLGGLAYAGVKTEDLIIALGLAVMRTAMIPSQVDLKYRDRELLRRAGFAEHLAAMRNRGDAKHEYDRLARDFPQAPGVHYARGRFLMSFRAEEEALEAFRREIEVSPNHALAHLQAAYIKLRFRDPEGARPFAEQAVALNPRMPLSHYLLGRILYDLGENPRAIEELEVARHLAPDEPRLYFALARAYDRAGRKSDGQRARETFVRLNKLAEEAAQRGLRRTDALNEPADETKPNQF